MSLSIFGKKLKGGRCHEEAVTCWFDIGLELIMRVLYISPDDMLGLHFRRGWEKAFRYLGFDFVASTPGLKELTNNLRERFDLIMTASGGEGIQQLPVDQLNECGTALVVNGLPFNSFRISPDMQAPLADLAEVSYIEKFNTKLIWSQWEPDFVETFFSGYLDRGIPVISLPYAGDIIGSFEIGDLDLDIVFIGNLRHRRRGNLPLIRNLLKLSRGDRIKLIGGSDWQRYLGVSAEPMFNGQDPSGYYRRAIVSPNIHTKRQREHGIQLNDRVFQIPASGGFQICDNPLVKRYFQVNELLFAHNQSYFLEMTDYFLRNPEKRIPYINAGAKAIATRHSYINRVQTILDELEISVKEHPIVENFKLKRHTDIGICRKCEYFVESRVMNLASLTRELRRKWM